MATATKKKKEEGENKFPFFVFYPIKKFRNLPQLLSNGTEVNIISKFTYSFDRHFVKMSFERFLSIVNSNEQDIVCTDQRVQYETIIDE